MSYTMLMWFIKLRPTGTPEDDNSYTASEVSDSIEATSHFSGSHDVSAVHRKPFKSRKTQISRHAKVQEDDSRQQAHNWRDGVQLHDKYSAQNEHFIGMPTGFRSMWDSHLGQRNMMNHRTKLLEDAARPVYSASHRTEPEAREFKKVEMDRMTAQEVVETAQSELAASIVFVPTKDCILCFCVYFKSLNALTKRDT